MEGISFEVIMRIALGSDGRSEREQQLRTLIPEMMDRCESPFTLLPWFRRELGGVSPYARLMRFIERVDQVLYEAIEERRADPLAGSAMTRSRSWSGDLRGRIAARRRGDPRRASDLLMAGYETTTAGLTWAFERLLRAPEKLDSAC